MIDKNKFNQIKEKYTKTYPLDVIGLANELGIAVYSTKIENDKVSGYISKDGEGYYICVNKKHPATRQHFTIAHEIGHYLLHKKILDAGGILPTTYKIGDGINPCMPRANQANPEYKKMEIEANRFAAELLMPKAEFIKKANECEDLVELARAFKVSVGAASIRANSLGIEII